MPCIDSTRSTISSIVVLLYSPDHTMGYFRGTPPIIGMEIKQCQVPDLEGVCVSHIELFLREFHP